MNMKTAILTALLASALWIYGEEPKSSYPLTTCVVSGEKLGKHGDTIVYMYKGQEIRFCCKDCIGDFEKNPDRYLKDLEEARSSAAGKDVELRNSEHHHGTAEDSATPAARADK
jgi:YHS domain-containing protein